MDILIGGNTKIIRVPGICQLAKYKNPYNIKSPPGKVIYANYPLVQKEIGYIDLY